MKRIIFSFIAVITLYACSATKPTGNEATLTGIKWQLKKIYLPAGNMEISNANAHIKFLTENKSAGGKGGCNSFGGSFTMTGKQVSIKNIFSTKMFCEQFSAQEAKFLDQLEKVNSFKIKDGRLYLYRDKELLLEFDRAAQQ